MDPVLRSPLGPRAYEDFVPPSDLIREEGFDMILMELPGFRKDHLKVQLDNFGNLRTSGECPVDGSRWRRFRKEFRLPDNCNTSEIRAKFENGILTITLPKQLITNGAQPTAPTPTPSVVPATPTPPPPPSTEPATQPPPPPSTEPATPPPPPPSPARAEPTAPTLPTAEAPAEPPAMPKQREAMEADQGERMEAKYGVGGHVVGLKRKRKQLLVNIAVAVVVLVGVVIYVAYKFRKVAEAETSKGLLDYEL